jgi:hypothetical protein
VDRPDRAAEERQKEITPASPGKIRLAIRRCVPSMFRQRQRGKISGNSSRMDRKSCGVEAGLATLPSFSELAGKARAPTRSRGIGALNSAMPGWVI